MQRPAHRDRPVRRDRPGPRGHGVTRRRVLGAVAVLLACLLVAGLLLARGGTWAEGEVHGRWTVLSTGGGEVSGDDDEVLLEPQVPAAPEDTRTGMVVTTEEHRDPDLEVTLRTEEQLRENAPDPWEVGWVLWNVQDRDRFYAVVLKPNGWEILKQDPDYPGQQRFLDDGTDRQFPTGRDYRVRVEHDWPRMTVSVDGQELATVVDEESPYRGGAVGLYSQDARARFSDLEVTGSS
jgi:ferric-dicitrate binding protein FerR (iron transport regulator)